MPLYAGIRYVSRLRDLECWALFDGTPVELRGWREVEPAMLALQRVLAMYGMTIRYEESMDEEIAAPGSTPDVTYHYTDAAGFLGILEDREFWLTDLGYMNDREELTYAADEVRAAVAERREALQAAAVMDDPEDLARSQASVLGGIELQILDLQAGEPTPYRAYAACFCSNGDLLSQWRAYAGGTSGFALGFKTELVEHIPFGDYLHAGLAPVHYGDGSAGVAEIAAQLGARPSAHPGVEAEYQFGSVMRLLAQIKNPGFREEHEQRLIAVLQQETGPLRFRPTRRGPVPYLACPFEPKALVEVIVGPGDQQAANEFAARQALQHFGFDPFALVEVRRSSTSYR
jgi:hypothetical protein